MDISESSRFVRKSLIAEKRSWITGFNNTAYLIKTFNERKYRRMKRMYSDMFRELEYDDKFVVCHIICEPICFRMDLRMFYSATLYIK